MSSIYNIPSWFAGYDIFLELLFALITGIVAYYAFRVYKVSKQRSARLFGLGFSFISASYVFWAIMNSIIMSQLTLDAESITINQLIAHVNNLYIIRFLSFYAHVILLTVGLVLLVYMTFKVKSPKAFLSTLILGLIVITASNQQATAFYLLSSIFFAFITVYYVQEYNLHRNNRLICSLIAFVLLFITSAINFLFLRDSSEFYVVGHILQLIAYVLVANNLYSSVKHGQKKKSP
ncbi:MAG: hypothetical protein WCK90_02990 [archaeon]